MTATPPDPTHDTVSATDRVRPSTGSADGSRHAERPLLALLLVAVLLYACAAALLRPPFQVSDEISYFAGVRDGASRAARSLGLEPPAAPAIPLTVDDRPLAAGKDVFRVAGGAILLLLPRSWAGGAEIYALRLAFVPFVVLAAWATFRLAALLWPAAPFVRWTAAVLVGFHPVFVAYGASVSPDAAANGMAALDLWWLALVVMRRGRWPLVLAAGALALAGAALKDTNMFLLPTWAGAVAWRHRGQTGTRLVLLGGLAVAAMAAVAAGFKAIESPYFRYLSWDSLERQLSTQSVQWWIDYARTHGPRMVDSFWRELGNFGANPLTLPVAVFAVLVAAFTAGMLAFCWAFLRGTAASHAAYPAIVLLSAGGVLLLLQPPLRAIVLGIEDMFQGRWLFPLLGPLTVFWAAGLQRLSRASAAAVPLVALAMGAVAWTSLLLVVVPFYYEVFPSQYRMDALFLGGPYGVPIAPELIARFVERPGALQETWSMAGVIVAGIAAWVAFVARARTLPGLAGVGAGGGVLPGGSPVRGR